MYWTILREDILLIKSQRNNIHLVQCNLTGNTFTHIPDVEESVVL